MGLNVKTQPTNKYRKEVILKLISFWGYILAKINRVVYFKGYNDGYRIGNSLGRMQAYKHANAALDLLEK